MQEGKGVENPAETSEVLSSGPPPPPAPSAFRTMKVIGVQLGSTVSKTLASGALTAAAFATVQSLEETAARAALCTQAQLQALGLVALRIPLSGHARLEQFAAAVAKFTAENQGSLKSIAQMTLAQQALEVGVQANVVGAIATAAIQEGIGVCYLLSGAQTSVDFLGNSIAVLLSGIGSLAGGAGGAVVGTLVVPGAGTALGALFGSFCGSYVPSILSKKGDEESSGGEAGGKRYRVREIEGGDWLEIVDCSTETQSFFVLRDSDVPARDPVASSAGGGEEEEGAGGTLCVEPTDLILVMREEVPRTGAA